MNVRNCNRCGNIYRYDGFKICHNCRKEDEKDFQLVREYLKENPGANISEVHSATEVIESKIIDFLRDGRLEVAEGGNLILECESCGKSITTGRFCTKCTENLTRELGKVVDSSRSNNEEVNRVGAKFRVADRYNKR